MIRSMTGYGSAGLETDAVRAAVTARSLNHRYLDVTVHLPRRLQLLEGEIKEAVGRTVRRGRVELSVQASLAEGPAEEIVPSRPLVASLVRALRDMQNEFGLEGGVAVSDLVRFPGALERAEAPTSVPEQPHEALLGLVGRALEALDVMRRAEGERLRTELERALEAIETAADGIEQRAAETREARLATLMERVRGLVAELGLDEGRLFQEVVRSVERHDVAEEIQRLRSHAAMARELVAAEEGPTGKRLDFLAQELMREANTVGSKVADAAQVQAVVGLKAEIERLREQVQNVE
ncbi:MAG: YicC/YloC family endoribonuclease [Acidobacteriota bacterium]|jgi:uncharacterized protein (TIGR00255 family)